MLVSEAVLFFIIAVHLPRLTRSYEYCSKEVKLCKNLRHIACYKDDNIAHINFIKHFPMTSIARKWVLYWLNTYRNEVACGRAKAGSSGLPPASAMGEVVWDYELEYLASLHSKRCSETKDPCRNTERIPIVGQLLHVIKYKPKPLDAAFETINGWFYTAKYVNATVLDSDAVPRLLADFQIMALDRIARVGCSIAQCKYNATQKKKTAQYMTCNFDYDFIVTQPVYRKGRFKSACRDYGAKCSNFTCLCGNSL